MRLMKSVVMGLTDIHQLTRFIDKWAVKYPSLKHQLPESKVKEIYCIPHVASDASLSLVGGLVEPEVVA